MVKLVAIDIDDTLINDQLEVPAANQEAIRGIMGRGVTVTLCTGRMHVSALPFAWALGFPDEQPIISYNGAMLRRINGEILNHVALSRALVMDVIAYCRERGWTLNAYHDDALYVATLDANVQYYTDVAKVPANVVGDLTAFILDGDKELSKLLIVGTEDEISRRISPVQEHFGQRAQIVRSKTRYIEITDPMANKGIALARLTEMMGLTREQVMAVGDSGNDLPMLEYAGLPVAMGNATPSLKEKAIFVTGTNEEAGVALALKRFV